MDFSGCRVAGHVTVGVGMDSGVRVAGVVVKDASVLNSGWSREKKGDVRRLDRGDWCEGMVRTDKDDTKAYS